MSISRLFMRFGRSAAMAALLGGLGATTVSAQSAIQFRGGGFFSNFSGCEAYGWVDQVIVVTARYSPAELASDGFVNLSIVMPFGAENYSRQGPLDFTFQSLQGNFIFTRSGRTSPRPRIRVLTQSPEVITEQTRDVQMRVRVRNFAALEGCQADVGLVLTRFPMLQ